MNITVSISLTKECASIVEGWSKGKVSKHIRECMLSYKNKNILPDPVIIARELDSGGLNREELKNWVIRINKQLEYRK